VSLRLLYLIFVRLCRWLVLLGRVQGAEALVLLHKGRRAATRQAGAPPAAPGRWKW
jgi:hypothetical protein